MVKNHTGEILEKLGDEIFDEYIKENTVLATVYGIHDYDHLLPDISEDGILKMIVWLKDCLHRVRNVSEEELAPTQKADRKALISFLTENIRDFDEVKVWRKNPGFYLDTGLWGIIILIQRDFAPLEERLKNVLSRLKLFPGTLADGKRNIDLPVEVFVETALLTAASAKGLFSLIIPALAKGFCELEADILEACKAANKALDDYVAFMERLLPKASLDFAVGRETFDAMLKNQHFLPYDAQGLLEKGKELMTDTLHQMEQLAWEIKPGASWQDILEEISEDVPSSKNLLDAYREEMKKTRAFVLERGLVDIPDGEELVIEETPSFLRPIIPYAAYLNPAPMEERQLGCFWVTPINTALPLEKQKEQLKEHNIYSIPITTVHEGYPGHHLQLTVANKSTSKVRHLTSNNLFIEGWAFYCEELMEEQGFLTGKKSALARLKDQLWRAARIVVDTNLHAFGMTIEEGVEFMVKEALLKEESALAEVRRYAASPTQPMSYLMGKLEIVSLVEEYKKRKGEAFNLQEFHNELLKFSSLPPTLVKEAIFSK